MDSATKTTWLKRILIFKILVCLLVWGLPSWLGPAWLLAIFGVQMPADPFFLRIFGALVTGQALFYWLLYRNPHQNRDMFLYAVVDNILSTLAILFVAFSSGLSSPTIGVSGVLTAFFAVAFWTLRPQE